MDATLQGTYLLHKLGGRCGEAHVLQHPARRGRLKDPARELLRRRSHSRAILGAQLDDDLGKLGAGGRLLVCGGWVLVSHATQLWRCRHV